ncbi:MAG: helix-turn-helix domain-containing protein [Alkaliphilus sp.]
MFSKRLKQLRKNKNITQSDLGKILNLSKQTVSAYEQGDIEPSIETLKIIASYFDVNIDFLIGYTSPKNRNPMLVAEDSIEYATNKEIKELNTESKKDLKKYIEFLKLKESEK